MRIRTAQGTIVQVLQELSPSNRSRLESLYIFAFITSARTPTGILCGGIFYAASWHFAKIRIYSTYLRFWSSTRFWSFDNVEVKTKIDYPDCGNVGG